MHLGQRIMIIGSGGAGKSTLARQLGALMGLPVIHLDTEHWQPGWVETPKDIWRQKVEELVQRERWIIDGNYGGTLEVRLAAADTVIFLDYAPVVCVCRVLKRRVMYWGKTRPDIGPDCPEKVDWAFLQWIWGYRRRSRPRIMQLLAQHEQDTRVVMLTSPGATRRFLAGVEREKATT